MQKYKSKPAAAVPAPHRRRFWRKWLGAATLVLVAVGLLTVAYGAFKLGQRIYDRPAEKAMYNKMLAPLVMLDPLPFESLEKAKKETLLQAAVWGAVYSQDTKSYERNENGALILPAIDMERSAHNLFGPDFQVTHATFSDSGMDFVYDETRKGYIVPITAQIGMYTPQTAKISGWGEKILTVGYVAPNMNMLQESTQQADVPVKYMEYILTKQQGKFYVSALRESKMLPPATSPKSASQTSTPSAPASLPVNSVVAPK